ncbi:MAG: porin [Gammaproteobacteria bacterium]
MNKKLIAAAVAASVAPFAAQAQTTVYGRINNAIDLKDIVKDGDGTTDITAVASRFGIKYSGDIGGGMTALGRYEFSTHTDREGHRAFVRADSPTSSGTSGVTDIRIATAGISGPFGTINVGNQWSSYFNTFGTMISPTYSLGYYLYSSVGGGPFRSSNTIKYSNNFGPLYVELDARLNESNETSDVAEKIRGDGFGFGATLPVGNLTLAVAIDAEDGSDVTASEGLVKHTTTVTNDAGTAVVTPGVSDKRARDTDRTGFAVKAAFSPNLWASVGWQQMEQAELPAFTLAAKADGPAEQVIAKKDATDITTLFLYVGGKLSNQTSWLVSYAQADDGKGIGDPGVATEADVTSDSTQVNWGLYHNIGAGLRAYYEAAMLDSENNGWDGIRHLLGMRVDF